MKPMRTSRHVRAVQAVLLDLLNDPDITDRQRLRELETIESDVSGFIAELRSRLPEPQASRRGDPPRI